MTKRRKFFAASLTLAFCAIISSIFTVTLLLSKNIVVHEQHMFYCDESGIWSYDAVSETENLILGKENIMHIVESDGRLFFLVRDYLNGQNGEYTQSIYELLNDGTTALILSEQDHNFDYQIIRAPWFDIHRGIVFVSHSSGNMIGLDLMNKDVIFISDDVGSSSFDGDYLFHAGHRNEMFGHPNSVIRTNLITGEQKVIYHTDDPIHLEVFALNGEVYFGGGGATVSVWTEQNGELELDYDCTTTPRFFKYTDTDGLVDVMQIE